MFKSEYKFENLLDQNVRRKAGLRCKYENYSNWILEIFFSWKYIKCTKFTVKCYSMAKGHLSKIINVFIRKDLHIQNFDKWDNFSKVFNCKIISVNILQITFSATSSFGALIFPASPKVPSQISFMTLLKLLRNKLIFVGLSDRKTCTFTDILG